MASLRGNIEDFGMADVFQLIAQQRKTGNLEFVRKGDKIQIQFDHGLVVGAVHVGAFEGSHFADMLIRCGFVTRERFTEFLEESKRTCKSMARIALEHDVISPAELRELEDLITSETLFDLLRWSEGDFDFHAMPVKHDRQRGELIPTDHILMDGLRMVDEWHQFSPAVPEDSLVFQKVNTGEDAERGLAVDVKKIYRRIDGRLSVRRIIDLSRIGTFEGTRIFAELRKSGLIDPAEVAAVQVEKKKKWIGVELNREFLPVVTATLGSVVALLVLMIGAVIAGHSAVPEAFSVRKDSLKTAEIQLGTLLLRNAVEAYRYAAPLRGKNQIRNEFPAKLDRLVEEGYVAQDALTGPNGAPYYYIIRGDSFVLLAPEF